MTKKLVVYIFLATMFICYGCHSDTVKKEYTYDFYELCFYFQKLPAKTTQNDVDYASEIYSGYLSDSGIKVLSRNSSLSKSCFFTDKEPSEQGFSAGISENNVAEYLLKAFFKRQSASLYGIKNSGKTIQKIYDEIPSGRKTVSAETIENGLEIKGSECKMLYFSRYLDNLQIDNSFGINSDNSFMLSVPEDQQGRWMIAMFLYNTLDLESIVRPFPGDFAIISSMNENSAEAAVRKSGWRKIKVERTGNEKNTINLKTGSMNLPFSEEALLKYLYSLSFSHRLPFENGFAYSPNFVYSSVIPQLYLFSGELRFSENIPDSENLFIWMISSERQLETYPDTLYANLLALKIAKKLVSGDKTFLGGKDLENKKLFVESEKIRESLFKSGNIAVSGKMLDSIYLFEGETILESSETAGISEISGFKALFGDPAINDTSIVTFVVRNKNAAGIIGQIEKSLSENNFVIIHKIYEKISENDAWSAVSVKTDIANESRLNLLYDKNYKIMDKTLSLGVYRVSEK